MRMTGSIAFASLVTLACTSRPSSHLAATAPGAASQGIVIAGRDALETSDGPVEHFTGHARVQRLFLPTPPGHMQGAYVAFEPGARTAWHSHPVGQILVVTAGSGRIQQWGGPVQALHEGDVAWTPPGVKHWHGATPTTAMTHMALVEQLDGNSATWMEKVSEAQYNSAP
jgi:4-carboxymuconolactone decarboxylase